MQKVQSMTKIEESLALLLSLLLSVLADQLLGVRQAVGVASHWLDWSVRAILTEQSRQVQLSKCQGILLLPASYSLVWGRDSASSLLQQVFLQDHTVSQNFI